MKKLIAVFLFCGISPAYVQGQVKFHGQVGMTISTFDRNLMEEYGFFDYRQSLIDPGINASTSARNSVRPGAVISIEMDVYLNENTFLKTGVKYTNGGDSYFFKTPDIRYQRYYGFTQSNTDQLQSRISKDPSTVLSVSRTACRYPTTTRFSIT